ncbi:MAG: redoxin domain-containing protein [Planctomycetes bacterium]|nr:redoxin domain-containing protein [Planctomycetota bacterium]
MPSAEHRIPIAFVVLAMMTPLASLGQSPDITDANTNSKEEVIQHVLVEGQVFDHSGGGVKDAVVTLTSKKDQSLLGETRTNEYGDFRITAESRFSGQAVVTVTKILCKPKSLDVTLTAEGDPPFVDHEMLGAVTLRGIVHDRTTEKPVPKVRIVVTSGYKDYEAETGPDGTFAIEELLPYAIRLRAKAEGYADFEEQIREPQNEGIRTILLSRERIVHLRVVGEDRQPIEGVIIEAVDSPHKNYKQTVTGRGGKATFHGLNFDSTALKLRLTHGAKVSDLDFERSIDLPADKAESDHELLMNSAGTIVGKVVSSQTASRMPEIFPVNGARISVGKINNDMSPTAWSDFEGAFEIQGVAPGAAVVTIHSSGHAPDLRQVTVSPDKRTTVEFKLTPARSITGVVKDPDGQPVAETFVTTTKWRGSATLGLAAMCNAAGAFEIIDAPLDSFQVSVYAKGYKPLLDQEISAGKSTYAFNLETDPRASDPGMTPTVKTGESAPDFSVTTLDGKILKLSALSGKVVLLDFWATWCGPCLGEVPGMIEIQKTYGSRDDFVMISVSLDSEKSTLQSFVKERKMNWHHGWGESANATANAYGVVAIPSIMVIDRAGLLVASGSGAADVKPVLEKLLKPGG